MVEESEEFFLERYFFMARQCSITGKKVMTGNHVSHAKNATRRIFLPNIQAVSLYSELLKRNIRVKISTKAIRTVEKAGGIDEYLKAARTSKLTVELRKVKRQLMLQAS